MGSEAKNYSVAGEIPDGAVKMLDEEARLAQERRDKISRVTLEIEEILLREEMTVGDLLEIFGLFTSRTNSVFEKITIKKIKEDYEQI